MLMVADQLSPAPAEPSHASLHNSARGLLRTEWGLPRVILTDGPHVIHVAIPVGLCAFCRVIVPLMKAQVLLTFLRVRALDKDRCDSFRKQVHIWNVGTSS